MSMHLRHPAGSAEDRSCGLFDVDYLEHAGFRVSERRYERGEAIFMAGDPTDRLYLLQEGMVRLYKPYGHYGEATVELLNDRGGFGEFDLSGRAGQRCSAQTLTDCRVAALRKADLRQVMVRQPELALGLFSLVSQKLRHSEQAMDVLMHREVSSRLSTLLPRLAQRFSSDAEDEAGAVIPLSHSEIADMIASTREAVSKALKNLEDEELIELGKRRIIVKDQQALTERSNARYLGI